MRSMFNGMLGFAGVAILALAAEGCSPEGGGGGSVKAAEAQCKHEVTEKFCPLCHPEVRKDPNVLLCKEHGNIPEDICTACHPELKAKIKACPHELPPAFCPQCQGKAGSEKKAN